jgi:hypothetical protein
MDAWARRSFQLLLERDIRHFSKPASSASASVHACAKRTSNASALLAPHILRKVPAELALSIRTCATERERLRVL